MRLQPLSIQIVRCFLWDVWSLICQKKITLKMEKLSVRSLNYSLQKYNIVFLSTKLNSRNNYSKCYIHIYIYLFWHKIWAEVESDWGRWMRWWQSEGRRDGVGQNNDGRNQKVVVKMGGRWMSDEGRWEKKPMVNS
jgi:hypothetical protein